MSIPGYDNWKLASPDDERGDTLCPFCGAYSPRQCEMEEETGGNCPWEEVREQEEYARDEAADAARERSFDRD